MLTITAMLMVVTFENIDDLLRRLQRMAAACYLIYLREGELRLADGTTLRAKVLFYTSGNTIVKEKHSSSSISGLLIALPWECPDKVATKNGLYHPLTGVESDYLPRSGNVTPDRAALMLQAYVMVLLSFHSMCSPAVFPKRQGIRKSISQRFLSLAGAHYQEQRQTRFYADRLCITEGYLRKIVRSELKDSPKGILLKLLVAEAISLLLGTEMPVKAIAFSLGFSEASPFSALFKKQTGMSPSHFRLYYTKKKQK